MSGQPSAVANYSALGLLQKPVVTGLSPVHGPTHTRTMLSITGTLLGSSTVGEVILLKVDALGRLLPNQTPLVCDTHAPGMLCFCTAE